MAAGIGIPIRESIETTTCWLCDRKFIECGGTDPGVIRNRHHVVPQANGGANGPTVTICSAHHDMLHAIATERLSGNEDKAQDLIQSARGTCSITRLVYLAQVVVTSTRLVANDPNKRAQLNMVLTPEDRRKLDMLCGLFKLSRNALLVQLLRKEFAQRFPR